MKVTLTDGEYAVYFQHGKEERHDRSTTCFIKKVVENEKSDQWPIVAQGVARTYVKDKFQRSIGRAVSLLYALGFRKQQGSMKPYFVLPQNTSGLPFDRKNRIEIWKQLEDNYKCKFKFETE
jgi:hypothetical protein